MRFEQALPVLDRNGIGLFSLGDLRALFPRERDGNLARSLQRWKAKGWIAPLKKGLYELVFPRDRRIPDLAVANRLYSPSYISLETALSMYSLIPEVSQAVMSVTTKPTRRFRNRHGFFVYRTLRPAWFTGYEVRREGEFKVLVAEPEKALADYLYLRNYRKKDMDLEDERIDWKSVRKLNLAGIGRYLRMFGMRMETLRAFL